MFLEASPDHPERDGVATASGLFLSSAEHAAQEYRALGWSVIPLDGKRPNAKALKQVCGSAGWKCFRTRPASEDDVIRRWYEAEPTAGVGVLTGKASGIVVADIEGDALATFPDAVLGLETPRASTPRGGLHLYFALDGPQKTLRRCHTGWETFKPTAHTSPPLAERAIGSGSSGPTRPRSCRLKQSKNYSSPTPPKRRSLL